jgi:hypothetical protein
MSVVEDKPVATYGERRSGMLYLKCVETFITAFAPRGRRLIDVGSKDSPLIERIQGFDKRVALDLRRPYHSENVKGIKKDFMKYNPRRRFTVALCLQVLEHVPDPKSFAHKLFDVAKNVIISVPYMWPEKSSRHHIHDLINEETLKNWTGREPSHSVIAQEVLSSVGKSRRLVAYYQDPSRPFSIDRVRKQMAARGQLSRSDH